LWTLLSLFDMSSYRKTLRWTWLAVAAVLLYAAVTVYLRSRSNRAIEEAASQKRAEQDRQILEKLGGGELKIVAFYANPLVLARGEKGLLCYGVANAKSVRIEPGAEPLTPSLSRCIEVKPARTTTYKLKATGADGSEQTQALAITVR
jgi:hypothetical protein